jgi:hypothetical protein
VCNWKADNLDIYLSICRLKEEVQDKLIKMVSKKLSALYAKEEKVRFQSN